MKILSTPCANCAKKSQDCILDNGMRACRYCTNGHVKCSLMGTAKGNGGKKGGSAVKVEKVAADPDVQTFGTGSWTWDELMAIPLKTETPDQLTAMVAAGIRGPGSDMRFTRELRARRLAEKGGKVEVVMDKTVAGSSSSKVGTGGKEKTARPVPRIVHKPATRKRAVEEVEEEESDELEEIVVPAKKAKTGGAKEQKRKEGGSGPLLERIAGMELTIAGMRGALAGTMSAMEHQLSSLELMDRALNMMKKTAEKQ